ncbi:bifunctional DNA-formamidopyrimidine glycosylase/DNA-(apurinic or apyrimidinic site) lyase [Actinomarinicola tropica]|uniref:Bifunctional DNA-formamidopyrimidine glycosylase/DNA-(Apurinic or apyrimidinic site) lyase n=1 Tax=Actinomarinicola tropica TaxID=2789776 RepID=A0A5Q2RH84_9ACTN|nr:bifunctional DNA-formamidopyrimidine glycosylase/DNA-(apurinic or apyrimidinic site) lyase [Actinomarinicola tropica]QGG96199.1 bifunctional DNA-formamidopyrimidine glycosylase/DNA-(apurinic or apyrimidinic site) lyase [Actinomarinicola tropica]
MPELPEVETIRRQLEPVVRGRWIGAAGGHPSGKFAPAVDAAGAHVEGVRRRGKYLLVDLDEDRELVVHLGMTGRLQVVAPDSTPSPYVRAWWDLGPSPGAPATGRLELHDVRRFGRVAVLPRGDHVSLPTLHRLGPEPFDPAFTGDHLWRALQASRAAVKTQLLSQRPVAGVGNIYADEALWRAGVHPAARRVGRERAGALRDEIVAVLAASIDRGGTTLRDYRTVEGATGTNQLHLECYGRAGEPCLRCGEPLRRLVVDGRGTTWCGTCQSLRRRVDNS